MSLIHDSVKFQAASGRYDANETAVFTRQLEHIYALTYDRLYSELKARSILNVNSSVPAGAESHTFRIFDRFGEAKILSTFDANDYPNQAIEGSEVTNKCYTLGAKYGYTIQEMKASAMAGTQLEVRRAEAARQAIETKLDLLACVGDAATGQKGVANLTGILNAAAGTGTFAAHDWTNAGTTAAQMVQDVALWKSQILLVSKRRMVPDTLLLPTAAMARVENEFVALSFGVSKTVKQFILEGIDGLKRIEQWTALDTADGASGPRALLLQTSPDVVEMVIPEDFSQQAPQLDGSRFEILCNLRWGGIKSVRPMGISYSDVIGG